MSSFVQHRADNVVEGAPARRETSNARTSSAVIDEQDERDPDVAGGARFVLLVGGDLRVHAGHLIR